MLQESAKGDRGAASMYGASSTHIQKFRDRIYPQARKTWKDALQVKQMICKHYNWLKCDYALHSMHMNGIHKLACSHIKARACTAYPPPHTHTNTHTHTDLEKLSCDDDH